MTSFPAALLIRFLPTSLSLPLPCCCHCGRGKICDHTSLVWGNLHASCRIVAMMAKRKSPTDNLPISFPPQCMIKNFGGLLIVKRNATLLSISAHRIPPLPCHHSEQPRLVSPRFRPSGRLRALKKALFTIEDPTHHASCNAEIVRYLFRKRTCNFL